MNSITTLKNQIVRYLEQRDMSGAKIMTAFPAAERAYPLERPVVAVGLDCVELAPAGFGGYWGGASDGELYGGSAAITVRFDLYSPLSEGADSLHELYESLCGHLLLEPNPFGFTKLWCGETAYDRSGAANLMVARASLRAAMTRGEDSDPITAFQLVRRG